MLTRKPQIPALVLALWLVVATLVSTAGATENTHRVEVRQGAGYTSGQVGINLWDTDREQVVTFVAQTGYLLDTLSVQTKAQGETAYTPHSCSLTDYPTRISIAGVELPITYTAGSMTVRIPERVSDDMILSATTKVVRYRITAAADEGIQVSGGGDRGAGESVTITAAPSGQAAITRVQVTRTDTGVANTADAAAGVVVTEGKAYPFTVSGGTVTMQLTATENLSIHFYSNGQPGEKPYIVSASGDRGAEVQSSRLSVERGGAVNVTADAERGYEITDIRLSDSTHTATGSVSDGRVWLAGKAYRIDRSGNRVTLRLTDVQSDLSVRFLTELDEDHIPVTISEGTGVEIDKDCGSTVRKGTDVRFTISPKSNYRLNRITLSVDGDSRSVDAAEDKIRVNGVNYELKQDGDSVLLYVDDVRAPVRVSATAAKQSAYDNAVHTGTARSCKIAASRTGANDGGSVTYTVTPDKGYRLDRITLRIGTQQTTADADSRTIKVGSRSYSLSLSPAGVLKLTVDQIRNDVTLSATAVREDGKQSMKLRYDVTASYFIGVGGNRFHPESPLTRAEAVVMLCRLSDYDALTRYPSCGAADVLRGAWYENEVNAFYDAGMETDGWFRPDAPVTRGELAVWLYRLRGETASYSTVCPDVPPSGALHDAVACGLWQGWITGYPDGTFRPGNQITRAETAKLINRAVSRPLLIGTPSVTFLDVPATHWAYREIVSAANYLV